jgi:GTP-binding protein
MESNFVDYVKIQCRSGKGGRGSMHLRHVKYNPNGGPDGGDGGNGGSIILRGNHNYWTLLHLRYQRHIYAEHGGNGGRDKCHGTNGKDIYIDVPCGTVVYNAETGKYVCDVMEDKQEVVLLKGGRGGLGNFQFRTATNQAPRYAQPGEPMQEMTIIMELKLLADVGLVGLPNAGKSTLLSALSSARPKIANYPFTTLEPSLGIVGYRDNQSFVMADIPGIIEGAAEGKGLGLRFLRHIERNSLLLFMVPGDTDDIKKEYQLLLNELEQFNPEMLQKHRVLAVTKCDLLDDELIEMLKETLPDDLHVVFISAVTGQGLDELKDVLWKELNSESNKIAGVIAEDALVHRDKDLSYLAAEVYDEDRDADEEIFGDNRDDDDDEFDDIEEMDDIEYVDDIEDVEDADDIEYIDIEDIEDLEDAEEPKEE